jgi:hypothetical protein
MKPKGLPQGVAGSHSGARAEFARPLTETQAGLS